MTPCFLSRIILPSFINQSVDFAGFYEDKLAEHSLLCPVNVNGAP